METVLIEWPAERIARVVINRPEALNAFNKELTDRLCDLMGDLIDMTRASAIILTGAGNQFSAGGDIPFLSAQTQADLETLFAANVGLVKRIASSNKPIIAAVDGIAAGGAFGYALHCDYIVATPASKFSVPFLRIGLVPDVGSIPGLVNRIGVQAARRMIYERAVVGGDKALAIGLVDRLVPSDQLQSAAFELASQLAELPPHALERTKRLLQCAAGDFQTYLIHEYKLQCSCFGSAEMQEGMRSFIEKRKPNFGRL